MLVHDVPVESSQRSRTPLLLGVGALIATALLWSSTRRTPSVLEDASRPISANASRTVASAAHAAPATAAVVTSAPTPPAKATAPPQPLKGGPTTPRSAGTSGSASVRAAAAQPPVAPAVNARRTAPSTTVQRAASPADRAIQLSVTTEPAGAQVTVNGIGWGVAPVAIANLPAGDKRIRVSMQGFATEERFVSLVDGRRQRLAIRLRPKS